MMENNKKAISTTAAPSPAGPYSQAIVTDDYVFVAGQRPADPQTGALAEGIENQTAQVIDNMSQILAAAGCSLDDVVQTTVYLEHIEDFDKMNQVYMKKFPKPYPARTTIEVKLRGILVEINAIAKLKKD